MVEVVPRDLTAAARAVLEFVLSADVPGAELLREQARTAPVVRLCDCGCPSVELLADGGSALVDTASAFAVEVRVPTDGDAPDEQIMLPLQNGRLSYLEYVYFSDKPPTRWPDLDRLELVLPGSATAQPAQIVHVDKPCDAP